MSQYLGDISAYALAVSQGYTGTEEEYAELMASYATVGQTAVTAAQTATTKASEAATSATTATNKASEAATSATTATTAAEAAQADADAAALDASQALSAASTATTKASEATTAAATATSAKTDAVAANTAAQNAKTAAQTAQTGAETAAASVQSSAAQIQTNADDISELKEDFATMESDGVVPSAEQILTDKGVTDSVPYHFRKTGGDGADRLYDQIVGGTVCFNQLFNPSNFSQSTTISDITFTNNGDGTVTANGTATARANFSLGTIIVISDHVYIYGTPDTNNAERWVGNSTYGTQNGMKYMYKMTISGSIGLNCMVASGTTLNNYVFKPQYFDLTAMFGTTIADYIYSLEHATAGAGVAFFKALFPNDYYPYDSGTLKSVEGLSEHKMTGFNQWDEEWEVGSIDASGNNDPDPSRIRSKNYTAVLPNTNYYFNAPYTLGIRWYAEDKSFISGTSISASSTNKVMGSPSNACYLRFSVVGTTTYNHDICINLSDPAKNGTYEPYKAHSYPLDDSLTLRGLFKLDANNNFYADGDTYEYTGKVTRNTILRAYQSGDESLTNAITDGTNTVVYSANASTEQADPYQHLQQCDPNGTEEYVSTGIVPVGHNSFYPENLRAKIEQLPWNFASLIAPTESTYTATRNYTTGSLFIVDNVLYKATSNIANGGTITPNTNCTATTLAEIISALA